MPRFSFRAYLRSLWRSFFPPSSDDLTQDEAIYTWDLTLDEVNADWDIRQLEHQYSVQHCERCFAKGPWNRPELEKSVTYVLDTLRETKHMIASLQEREKRLKAEVQQLQDLHKLDHLVDPEDPQKFNLAWVSLCKGRKRRVYDSAVQMEIDAKQKEIDRIKYLADRREQFTDEFAPSYWRVSLKDEVL